MGGGEVRLIKIQMGGFRAKGIVVPSESLGRYRGLEIGQQDLLL